MKLTSSARIVVTAAVIGGLTTLVIACVGLARHASPSATALTVGSVFGFLVAASWLRPLIIYVNGQSKAIQLDEAFFVVFVLLVPPDLTIVVYALAVALAQAVSRRPFVKSAFNLGQILVSVGAGFAVFGLFGHRAGPLGYSALGAALVATIAYSLINNLAVSCILAASKVPWRQALLDGAGVRLLFEASSVTIALGTSLLISFRPSAVPIAVVPLFILRQVLVGHFQARHDRARFKGLYEATVDINRPMGSVDIEAAIISSAQGLLRCSEAALVRPRRRTAGSTDQRALSSELELPLRRLDLTVSGRSRTEPFDTTDQELLDALAAVGTAALSNAAQYEESRFQRQRLSAITSSLGEGVCAVNRSGRITFMNPAASKMLGHEPVSDLDDAGLTSELHLGPRAPSYILAPAVRSIANRETISSFDSRFQRVDGSYFHVAFTVSPILDSDGPVDRLTDQRDEHEPSGAVLVFRDITERKLLEERLERHAFHDALTGLPNRRLFLDHLEHALRRSIRSKKQHAVLFVDIDRFKLINDGLGHHAGDQLLIVIGERLRSALRPSDLLARFGGDEFTILLEEIDSPEDAVVVAQRILDHVQQSIALTDGHDVVATVSIGIAVTSADQTRDDVLHDADVAMYQAKARGRGGHYEVFDMEAMGVRSAERIELETALRRAIDHGELVVHYQPLFSMASRQVVGAEALVRWNHPTRGLLEPAQFISLAEDTGLILPLGRVVFEEACRQTRRWSDQFGARLSVGVNLSARQFQQAGLVEELEDVLRVSGVDPSQMLLEITETLAADRVERTIETLMRLKALGCQVAIDDFGSGYSSLGYLADFPVDVVKVDRTFIDGVDLDPVKSAIVSAVLTMSNAIGMLTVVEGVETVGQLEHLSSLGCEVAQGFYFARPMPASEFADRFFAVELQATAEQVG